MDNNKTEVTPLEDTPLLLIIPNPGPYIHMVQGLMTVILIPTISNLKQFLLVLPDCVRKPIVTSSVQLQVTPVTGLTEPPNQSTQTQHKGGPPKTQSITHTKTLKVL